MSVLIYVVTYIYIYIYIYICIHICIRIYIFLLCQPFALQSCSRNCYPAPDLVCFKPDSARVLLSGGVFFFTDTGFRGFRAQKIWALRLIPFSYPLRLARVRGQCKRTCECGRGW